MAATSEHGNQINHAKTRYALADEAIAAGRIVIYSGTAYGTIRLPDSAGETPAGVTSQAMASGDAGQSIFYGELCWIPVAEAVTIGAHIMAGADTGYEGYGKIATTGTRIIGVALTAQSTQYGYALVDMALFGALEP